MAPIGSLPKRAAKLRAANSWVSTHRDPSGADCTFLYFRCGTESHLIHLCIAASEVCNVSQNRFHTRQAAVALLKMAKATSDPGVAAKLVEAAADLKDQAGELPPPTKPPDVLTEE
jgi:hypothetical protein